jgi:replicative DNA helicase
MSDQDLPILSKNRSFNKKQARPSEQMSELVFGKIPPQAIPLEEAVLGAILIEKEALSIVMDTLKESTLQRCPSNHLPRHDSLV